MKTKVMLLSAVAAVASLTGVARADDAVMSPKGRQMHEDSRIVPGTTPDMLDRSYLGAAAKLQALQHPMVAGTSANETTVQSDRPLYTGKNPARDFRRPDFQVAPLK